MVNRRKKNKKNKVEVGVENENKKWDDYRCFGEYRCKTCNRRWMSGNAWKIYGQKCRTCTDTYVLPHKLRPLRRPGGLDKSDPRKPHLSDLCQLCQVLGHCCRR